MLSYEERIQLRDELIDSLLNLSITNITITKIAKYFDKDSILKSKYNLYVSEFRSEEEALYCLRHRDDYENHKCVICKKYVTFYKYKGKSVTYKYPKVCSKTYQGKQCNSKQSKQKRANTNLKRFNATTPAGNPNIVTKMQATNLKSRAVNVHFNIQQL